MTLISLLDALVSKLEALDYEDDQDVKQTYFDKVWIREPEFKNNKFRSIAVVEIQSEPTFYYSSCKSNTTSDVDFIISIFTRGTLEGAKRHLYTLTDIVKAELIDDPKITNNCLDSTIEEIRYGEYAIPSQNVMTSASQIILRCKQ